MTVDLPRWRHCSRVRRAIEAALLASALLVPSCAPRQPRAATAALENELPAGSRVVLQQAVESKGYQFTDPSGRFAVFDDVVVDLASDRVAWLHDGEVLPILTQGGHLLRSHSGAEEGVELWNLLDGSTQLFLGSLVPHLASVGRVALQRGQALDIVDTVLGQRVALLPALGTIVSVIPSGAGWRILARTGQRREQPGLVLLSTPPAPSDDLKTLAIHLPTASFSLAGRTAHHSDPFLSLSADGQLRANVVEACAACSAAAQFTLWSSAIDQQTGKGDEWTQTRFDHEHPPGSILPLVGPHVPSTPPVPFSVNSHLERMRGTSTAGTILDIAPDGRRVLTGASDRVCVWSLDRAERAWCERRAHQLYQFADSTHVWMSTHDHESPEIAFWDLSTRKNTSRVLPSGSVVIPGRGEQLLAYRYRASDRTYDIELWRLANDVPVWTHEACAAPPFFAARGARVVCPEIDIDKPVELLEAASGRVLDARSPRPEVDYLPQACGLDVKAGSLVTLARREQALVSFYDLTPTEWAIVLSDGRWIGTAEAPSYLAFYGPSGEGWARDQVERLHDRGAVQSVLGELAGIAGNCPPRRANLTKP